MKKIIILFCGLGVWGFLSAGEPIVCGAERMEQYVPQLDGKKVGLLTNHTGLVAGTHLVDTLVALGVDVRAVFAPEHGFRGDADAGEKVSGYKDPKTGIPVISIYGANRKPKAEDVARLDVVVFDIQDVGLRYYTYLSSMHYMMETCAEVGVPLIVLDRPNPNGMTVDGPLLDPKHRSFVGMHPIPVVHGMTLGELARMINGEGWLAGGAQCNLRVVPCTGYTHACRYTLSIKPSPNLPNMRSVYLYPSLCIFEATPVSIARGTDFPFQAYGHPELPDRGFSFTPRSVAGAKNPPLLGKKCYGVDLREQPSDEELIARGVDLRYLIDAYRALNLGDKFFLSSFERLIGVDYVRRMIREGCGADEIRAMWRGDVERFREQRRPYLIYEE